MQQFTKKLLNTYYNLEIKKKFVVMILPIVFIIIASSVIINYLYKSALEDKIIEANIKTLQLIENDLESETQKIEDAIKSICMEDIIFDFSDERFRKFYQDKGGLKTITLGIQKMFTDKMALDNKITDIAILSSKSELVFSSSNKGFNSVNNGLYDNEIRAECLRLAAACKKPEIDAVSVPNKNLLIYILPIYGKTEYKEVGKLFILFTNDYLEKKILKNDTDIYDPGSSVTYQISDSHYRKIYLSSKEDTLSFNKLAIGTKGHLYKNIGNKKSIVFYSSVGKYGFQIIKAVPFDYAMIKVNYITRLLILIIFLMITIVILLFYYTFAVFSNKMSSLINTMKEISSGKLSKRFSVEYHDEIGIIGSYLNTMVDEIELLIKNMSEIEVKNREAQLNVLQSQINPHFLYNTLDSIRMTALINKDKKAADMIHTLSNLFRYSIKKGSIFVPMESEIQHMKDYLDIQEFRYSGRFDIIVDIDDEILQYYIIKLILQPIVENSIYHGLEMKKGRGTLKVKGYLENNEIIFKIQDNGIGIEFNQLKLIRENLTMASDTQESRSIGLKNVYDRIKYYFGDKYGLCIESAQGEWTRVTINLPAMRELS